MKHLRGSICAAQLTRALYTEFCSSKESVTSNIKQCAGDTGSHLFIFKGTRLPYRTVILNVSRSTETYVDHLSCTFVYLYMIMLEE